MLVECLKRADRVIFTVQLLLNWRRDKYPRGSGSKTIATLKLQLLDVLVFLQNNCVHSLYDRVTFTDVSWRPWDIRVIFRRRDCLGGAHALRNLSDLQGI